MRFARHLRYLIPLVLLMTGLLPAQVFFPHRFITKPPTTASGPPIADITYWWVATDLTANAAVTMWTDRISGSIWSNTTGAATVPTNKSTGVYFHAAENQWLSNKSCTFTTNSTHFFIVQRELNGFRGLIASNNGGGMVIDYESSSFWQVFLSAPKMGLGQIAGTNAFFDMAICSTGTVVGSSGMVGFSNGVTAASTTNAALGPCNWGILGFLTGEPFQGFVKEIIVCSNRAYSASEIAALHNYATSTYGYSP